ncbi:MAG: hypothetical protein ACI841_003183 [Planctomycetota bacterium]|jgi:hypothetical protein
MRFEASLHYRSNRHPPAPAIRTNTRTKMLKTSAPLILLALVAIASCQCVPVQKSDPGLWTEYEVIDRSADERPGWIETGIVGYAESRHTREMSRKLALRDALLKAATTMDIQVDSTTLDSRTDNYDFSTSKTTISLNSNVTVEYMDTYWEQVEATGRQFDCPAVKKEYRSFVLVK